ncbi:MAG: hypothetical protein Q4C60_09450 [Eubacteriales bacterium]|nr:hypothetical protein [Eubacteriales bacterium]
MTEKQQHALQTILSALPEDCRESYREIAEYAISLGYMPALKGSRKDYADFSSPRLKRTLLKINANPDCRGIAIKFYALPEYRGVFRDAIEKRLAYWNKLGYEAKCFGCGKCDGTHGYPCVTRSGERGFLCGFGVVPIPAFTAEHIEEVKEAMKIQDEFFKR